MKTPVNVNQRDYLGLQAAARVIGISPITLKKILAQERTITHTVVGKRFRFKLSDLKDYLERATRHAVTKQD